MEQYKQGSLVNYNHNWKDKASTQFDSVKLQANHLNISLDVLDQSIQIQLRILFDVFPPFPNSLFRWSTAHNW